MVLLLILGGILLITGIVLDVFSRREENRDMGWWSGLLMAYATFLLIGAAREAAKKLEPTAMDVYQNKTTLQYTIQDSIAIDSTVVWKPGYEPK